MHAPRLLLGAVAAAPVLLLLAGPGGASVEADAVTMRMTTRTTDSNVKVFVLSGRAGRERRQVVEVLRRDCGESSFRGLGATRTRAGGRWRLEYPPELHRVWRYPEIRSGTTLRARWNGTSSAPLTYRSAARMEVSGVLGTLTRTVHVIPPATVSLHGKPVLLQQLRGRDWFTIREARLAQAPHPQYGPLNHEATFTVQRGWMLRGVLPAKSAAPCYLRSATEPFRVW